MIEKLRKKFTLIASVIVSAAILFVTVTLNAANLFFVKNEIASDAAAVVSGVNGTNGTNGARGQKRGRKQPARENRYFNGVETGEGIAFDMTHIAGLSEQDAREMTETALAKGTKTGFVEDCYFVVLPMKNGRSVWFLDCAAKLDAVRTFRSVSFAVASVSVVMACLLAAVFGRRAVRPFAENDEKQKRFITDASHELKTPLSVIGANMEVLKTETGGSEWIDGTLRQVGVMKRLVNELVFLAKTDEAAAEAFTENAAVSEIFSETAEAFALAAEAKGQTAVISKEDGVTLKADSREIEKVVSVLCDNAVKYAPEGDELAFRMYRERKYVVIETENSVTEPISSETLTHLFDRFYRKDSARTGGNGFGIGLAIARAAAEKYGGSAEAVMHGERLRISVRFRQNGRI